MREPYVPIGSGDRHERRFCSADGKRYRRARFGVLFPVDSHSGLVVGACNCCRDGAPEGRAGLSCWIRNRRRLPRGKPTRLSSRGEARKARSTGPIEIEPSQPQGH
jgi:hypothetical protein